MGAAMIGPMYSLRENGAQHGGRGFHLRASLLFRALVDSSNWRWWKFLVVSVFPWSNLMKGSGIKNELADSFMTNSYL